MINILLNGCNGKMGKVVLDCQSKFSSLKISAGVDLNSIDNVNYQIFSKIYDCNLAIDVVLDFSRPGSLDDLLSYCISRKLPLVLCTTGFSAEALKKIESSSKIIPIFRSANMSVGINLVNNILRRVSKLLYSNFDIEIIEKHHNQKVDAPSGTALMLADTIKNSISDELTYVNGRNGIKKKEHNEIGIHAIRGGSIVGEHEVIFAGQGETIEIKHEALSRDVFAMGALKACEFIYGKAPGLYNMDNLIEEGIN